METRRIPLGDLTLEMAEAGVGGRPFLVVHGFGGAKEDFTGFLDRLAARGWHTAAPDLRGHGASDKPPGIDAYGLDVFSADLIDLLDALGWDSAVVLGHSMGGMVVQHLALAHPGRVRALVLMDTAHGPMDWLDPDVLDMAAAVIRDHGVEAFVALSNELRDSDPLVTPAFRRLLDAEPGYAEFCDRKALAAAADMRLAMMPVFSSQPERLEALAGVAVPVLVIAGEQDDGFLQHCERMAETIPGARLAVIPDAGHSPQFENPEAWWGALVAFLDGIEGGVDELDAERPEEVNGGAA